MKSNRIITGFALVSALALAGCASPYQETDPNQYPVTNVPANNATYGVVQSIQVVRETTGNNGIGTGAVVGGVVGGVVGNQIGKGSGRTLATAAGVVGGALVGNQIQQNNQQVRDVYQVGIRMDNGAYQTMTLDTVGDLRVGNRVRIVNNQLYRY